MGRPNNGFQQHLHEGPQEMRIVIQKCNMMCLFLTLMEAFGAKILMLLRLKYRQKAKTIIRMVNLRGSQSKMLKSPEERKYATSSVSMSSLS